MQSELSAEHFHNEEAAFAYVEARLWPTGPVCPHCEGTERIGKLNGKAHRPGLYKCYACRKQFTVRQKSIFEASHAPMHIWLQAFYMMCGSKKGIATRQLQRTFGCSMKTAWFLGHRIREAMKEGKGLFTEPMGGAGKIVEADETFMMRKASADLDAHGPRGHGHLNAVLSLVERGGAVRSFHVPNVTASNLLPIIVRHIHSDTRFMTDESIVYPAVGPRFASHETVNHSVEEYVRGDVTTNTVEGYFSLLKRGVYGCYFHISEAHLGRYLAEFDFRYTYRIKTGFDDIARTDRAIVGAKGKRLMYQTASGRWKSDPRFTAGT